MQLKQHKVTKYFKQLKAAEKLSLLFEYFSWDVSVWFTDQW